ncbi:hypothetical protein DFR48_10552 [Ciceribacter lividus]|uniref:Uncharacterized protein n=1 Tax=Ciceribacter lividus TaxID=1197950 RepID=A0A6I7HPX6_9HYPH|nr:hypothetical protein [Ciceribacter lividus]RCW24714.1 hypothetical protein DFR48_10552 [Ciceribacter lividus]
MIALVLNALTGGLLKAWQAKLTADSDEKRVIADAAIADINRQIEARREATEIRRATAGFWEMRVAIALVAWPLALHLALVTLDTMLTGVSWGIPRLPAPMDEWQATILLSLFGLQGVTGSFWAIAAVIRGRR